MSSEVDYDFYMRSDAFAAFEALQKHGYVPGFPYCRGSSWRLPVSNPGRSKGVKLLEISLGAVESNMAGRVNYM